MGPLAFSPDGAAMATAAYGNIAVHDLTTSTPRTVKGLRADGDVVELVFSPDGQLLVTANWNHTGQIWDLATTDLLFVLTGHGSPLTGLALATDGLTVATCAADGVLLWTLPGPTTS